MTHDPRFHPKLPALVAVLLTALTALALLAAGSAGVSAQSAGKGGTGTKPLPPVNKSSPASNQVVPGAPLNMTFEDTTQMQIRYRDYGDQFYGSDAEGVYLWVNVAGVTTVYGPGPVPAGLTPNAYTHISNTLVGNGSPSTPWVVTTVESVPNTNLRLTQTATYVNGAEFVTLSYKLAQIGGSSTITATLFHAADLYTAGNDHGYGYYDSSTGGVGDYFTPTTGSLAGHTIFQQFVPSVPSHAYQEAFYATIWSNIGDTSGPGPGFNNTIDPTYHDSAAGLQWNLTVPPGGNVTVGDTDLFSPHASLCGSFSDVPYGSYNYEFIYYLSCHHIVSGYPDTTFRPNNPVSRGQLAKMVSNSAGWTDPPGSQMFEDVAPGSAFYTYTQRIASRGFINGYACGSPPAGPCVPPGNLPYFKPNNNATRGQIAKIIANAKGWTENHTEQSFQDVPPGSTFYQYVQRMSSRSIVGGYPCGGTGEPCVPPGNLPYYRPNADATRGQVSKIVANAFFPGCCSAIRP